MWFNVSLWICVVRVCVCVCVGRPVCVNVKGVGKISRVKNNILSGFRSHICDIVMCSFNISNLINVLSVIIYFSI